MVQITTIGDKPQLLQKEAEKIDHTDKLNQLASMTYPQIETYIDNNVTDLQSAKQYLKTLSKALIALTRLVLEE